MLVSMKEMLADAQARHYAIPAFDVSNYEMMKAVLDVCEEEGSPALLQGLGVDMTGKGLNLLTAMVTEASKYYSIPICFHLDHATDLAFIKQAVEAGFSSVMYDGSVLPFEENAAMTAAVTEFAHARGITVEAELGTVGGKEDGHSADIAYTDPDEAIDFFSRTGVDIFAVAIGTAHGFYKGEPKLNFELLDKLAKAIEAPLVLHGGSGIPDEMIRRTIELGINKVNFATELRAAMTVAVREALTDEGIIDPKKFMGPGRNAVIDLCCHKIKLCGSDGKA